MRNTLCLGYVHVHSFVFVLCLLVIILPYQGEDFVGARVDMDVATAPAPEGTEVACNNAQPDADGNRLLGSLIHPLIQHL